MRILLISFVLVFNLLNLSSQESRNGHHLPDFDSLVTIPIELPIHYDLCKTKRLGEVKSQPNGGCWASAATGSVESVRRTSGYKGEDFSDDNLRLFHGFVDERSTNGNHHMATAYFTRGAGPLISNPENDTVNTLNPEIPFYVNEARYLPYDPEIVKRTIINFGAVYSMMYHSRKELDTLTNIYYTKTKRINHAVVIVGWNDTMPTKNGLGAWIVQNSLGKKYGNEGIFYIPYSDPNILEYNAIWPSWIPYEEDTRIYYYDTLGSYHSYGFDDTICYGLVKFVAETDIEITQVSTHINLAGTKVITEIFDDFNPATGMLSPSLIRREPDQCRFSGYYTFKLAESIRIARGDDFYVLMGYSHPSDTVVMPVENKIKGYSDPHITEKKCWVNPDYNRWPTTWYECGSDSPYPSLNFDLCIRVYCRELK